MATSITPVTTTRTAVAVERTGINLATDPVTGDVTGLITGRTVDADGNEIEGIMCEMTAEEYDAWGSDDAYPTTLLIQKNGLA